MDASAIGAALSSLNSIKQVLGALVSARDRALVDGKIDEVTAQLREASAQALASQKEQAALLKRVLELEREVVRLRERNHEREKYSLQEVYPSAFAYVRQATDGEQHHPHWLCQHCFEKGQNFVLQSRQGDRSWRVWFCPECKTEFKTNPLVSPSNPFRSKES